MKKTKTIQKSIFHGIFIGHLQQQIKKLSIIIH